MLITSKTSICASISRFTVYTNTCVKTSFPNVDETNNLFRYSIDGGQNFNIFNPEGSYDLDNINKAFQFEMKRRQHRNKITIKANTNTLKSVIELPANCQIDFRPENSIASMLGFDIKILTASQESQTLSTYSRLIVSLFI